MNLLLDSWIPVRSLKGPAMGRLLTLQELLCGEEEWEIALPRDDLEMACLQLLICLVQVMFPPDDARALRQRAKTPLSPEEYAEGAAKLVDWFDLDHPDWPFMQRRDVKATKVTPIQKLLIGLPEGNNHAFFNAKGEVKHLSQSIAALALFHQATNCPSFGGSFMGSLRGGAPITTLVDSSRLREKVWWNVITRNKIQEILPGYDFDFGRDKPSWVQPIDRGATVYAADIGLLRGLFWQPANIQLNPAPRYASCDVIKGNPCPGYDGFLTEKYPFVYASGSTWPHPHSPFKFTRTLNKHDIKFVSFTTTAPAWMHMSEFVVYRGDNSEPQGSCPALPVLQFEEIWWNTKPLKLLVGGYRAKKASILERRHDLISLASSWESRRSSITEYVELAMEIKEKLVGAVKLAEKGKKKPRPPNKPKKGLGTYSKRGNRQTGLFCLAEEMFYRRTENSALRAFADMPCGDDARFNAHRINYVTDLSCACKTIFDELTEPYYSKPELVPIIAEARTLLSRELNKLKKEVTSDGREQTQAA